MGICRSAPHAFDAAIASSVLVPSAARFTSNPQRFDIIGAGWGHGVGLCQIGAAVMGEEGFDYDAILLHYYQGAEIKKVYK